MELWVLGFSVWVGILVGWLCYENGKRGSKKTNNKQRVPRGNMGWPLIGETIEFIASGYTSKPVSFMEKRRSLYGKVFKTHILGTPIIVSTDADVNKVVLQNHASIFVPAYPKSVSEIFGQNSILKINGKLHKKVHAIIGGFLRSPHFKARIARHIETSVNLCLAPWKHMQLLYVQDEIRMITFDVLVKLLMSVGPGEDLKSLKAEFQEFIKGLICVPLKLPGTRLYKSLKAKERMSKIVGRIVEERKNNRNKNVEDVVDVLLQENSEGLPLDFVTGNIIEMMIPGEETMPTAITLAVKYLSDNPLALEHLREENMKVKNHKLDSCSDYEWTDYTSLPFTQNVISETLRMANIINGIWRKAQQDVEIQGYFIPKGWCVLASLTSVHLDDHNYQNPYKFDPWRWEKLKATANNINYTPFGGGQRLCPGLELSRLELAVFLHRLVTTYRWEAEKDEIVYFPTVKMKNKMPIRVTSTIT
ncbi:hypothetical protein UlMin_039855 [Ulmus minor]